MSDGRDTKTITDLMAEFSSLDKLVGKLENVETGNTALINVPPEILEGYVAFGALMCYTSSHADDRAVEALERAWEKIAPTLNAETPAPAGAAG